MGFWGWEEVDIRRLGRLQERSRGLLFVALIAVRAVGLDDEVPRYGQIVALLVAPGWESILDLGMTGDGVYLEGVPRLKP